MQKLLKKIFTVSYLDNEGARRICFIFGVLLALIPVCLFFSRVYADCGCTVQNNLEEWNKWFGLLEDYDTIAFRYKKGFEYPWQQMVPRETIDAVWTKNTLIQYFDSILGGSDWIWSGQIWSGLILACRNSKSIRMWMDITLMHPELVIDCFGNELDNQRDCFVEHRHDQSVWSAVCSYWESADSNVVKVLEETAESDSAAAVLATRIHDGEKESLRTRTVRSIKKLFGDRVYSKLHFWK